MKRAQQYITNLIFRGLIGMMLMLPYETRVRLMGWLVERIVSPLAGYPKRIRANLAHVMPELPKAEVDRLCRAVPNNAGRTLIEMYSGQEFVQRAIEAPVTGPGYAKLEAARAEGRPAILVSAHFGSYDAGRANFIAKGHNMAALYRRLSNPWFNDHYVASITEIGAPMFEQGRRGISQTVRHIKSGGVLAIMTDLHAYGGARLNFFGKPAITSLVTAEMALKYNAALIPVYSLRAADGLSFEIIATDEIPHSDPETMMQAVNDGLEALIRENMHQWFWIHRRWKNT